MNLCIKYFNGLVDQGPNGRPGLRRRCPGGRVGATRLGKGLTGLMLMDVGPLDDFRCLLKHNL